MSGSGKKCIKFLCYYAFCFIQSESMSPGTKMRHRDPVRRVVVSAVKMWHPDLVSIKLALAIYMS